MTVDPVPLDVYSSKFFKKAIGDEPLWQHPQWVMLLKAAGDRPSAFFINDANHSIGGFILTTRRLPLGFSYAHLGRGPVFFPESTADARQRAIELLCQWLKKQPCQYLLWDPPFYNGEYHLCHDFPSIPKGIIPDATRYINLEQPLELIWANMEKKGRYNTRLAMRAGLEVHIETDHLNLLQLITATAQRKNLTHISEQRLLMLIKYLNGIIFTITDNDRPVASALYLQPNRTAYYYTGGSSPQCTSKMGSYLLQWKMIEYAWRNGAKRYDFLGVSPELAENHYLKKVSAFKKRFGGYVHHFENHKLVINSPFHYKLFSTGKKLLKIYNCCDIKLKSEKYLAFKE